jgi:hypothetical protein
LSDGNFWGVSVNDFGLIKSSDGITWVSVPGNFNGSDITYGKGIYVVAETGKESLNPNSLIYSSDAINWYQSTDNIDFTSNTVEFG